MNKCPNPSYDLECPYALSESSPVPCMASQEECNKYRKGRSEEEFSRPEYDVESAKADLVAALEKYKRAYEISKEEGDEEFVQAVLRLASGAKSRLMRLELEG